MSTRDTVAKVRASLTALEHKVDPTRRRFAGGVKADNKTDDTKAWKAVIDSLGDTATARTAVIDPPPGTSYLL